MPRQMQRQRQRDEEVVAMARRFFTEPCHVGPSGDGSCVALRCPAQNPADICHLCRAEYLRNQRRKEWEGAEHGGRKGFGEAASHSPSLLKCRSCVTHSIYARGTHARTHTERRASLSLTHSLSILLYCMAWLRQVPVQNTSTCSVCTCRGSTRSRH